MQWLFTDWLTDWAGFNVSTNTVYVMWGTVLQVKRPNQRYQSTEGTKSTQITEKYNKWTQNTANPLVYTNMGWLGDGSHKGQGCQVRTAVGLPPRYPVALQWWTVWTGHGTQQVSYKLHQISSTTDGYKYVWCPRDTYCSAGIFTAAKFWHGNIKRSSECTQSYGHNALSWTEWVRFTLPHNRLFQGWYFFHVIQTPAEWWNIKSHCLSINHWSINHNVGEIMSHTQALLSYTDYIQKCCS